MRSIKLTSLSKDINHILRLVSLNKCSIIEIDNYKNAQKLKQILENNGYYAIVREREHSFFIKITNRREDIDLFLPDEHIEQIAYIIRNAHFGCNNKELGSILMNGLINSLYLNATKPQYVIFMGDSVKLTCNNSLLVSLLSELEKSGVNILVCNTSLEFYKITHKLMVGRKVKFSEIVSIIGNVKKIITI